MISSDFFLSQPILQPLLILYMFWFFEFLCPCCPNFALARTFAKNKYTISLSIHGHLILCKISEKDKSHFWIYIRLIFHERNPHPLNIVYNKQVFWQKMIKTYEHGSNSLEGHGKFFPRNKSVSTFTSYIEHLWKLKFNTAKCNTLWIDILKILFRQKCFIKTVQE